MFSEMLEAARKDTEMQTKQRSMSRWYDRERRAYMADRKIAEAYADWFKEINWKLFCTFTFAWRVSDQQAIETFAGFINRLESLLKCDVGYVRGDEKRFSGCGKPACARHFHVLLTCTALVDPELIETIWMSMAGHRANGAGALVKPYDANLNGASYVMKLINQPEGDWAFRKLHLFHPSLADKKTTARSRRYMYRHQGASSSEEEYRWVSAADCKSAKVPEFSPPGIPSAAKNIPQGWIIAAPKTDSTAKQ